MLQKIDKFLFREFSYCPERFWLRINVNPPDEQVYDLMKLFFKEQKEKIEEYAFQILQKKEGYKVERQKVIESEFTLARLDLYGEYQATGKTAFYEVFNSKGFKSHRLWDLAFLYHTLKLNGKTASKVYAVYLNSDYKLEEKGIVPEDMIVFEDVTVRVKKLQSKIKFKLKEAIEFALLPTRLNHSCGSSDCLFQSYYNLQENPKVSESSISEEIIINKNALKKWISNLSFPIYFLDYEAVTASIPVYKGSKPFQHIVFQFSLHTLSTPDAAPKHIDFIPMNKNFPVKDVLYALYNNISDDSGSILVWHDSFEKARNREMANMFPEYSDFLKLINNRIVDLEKIFNHEGGLYLHPKFEGKSSIKKIFPVLFPNESSYDSLEISDGMTASILWYKYLNSSLTDEYSFEKLREQLLNYCGLDTSAMVKILKFLFNLDSENASQI